MQRMLVTVLLLLVMAAYPFMASAKGVQENFEEGEWAEQPVGVPLTTDSAKTVNGWVLEQGNETQKFITLEPDPYHEGGYSVLVNRKGDWASGSTLATKSFDPITGSATVSVRLTTPQTFDGRGHYVAAYSSDSKRLLNLGFGQTSNAIDCKDWVGRDLSIGQWGTCLGLYFAPGALPNGKDISSQVKDEDGRLSYVQLERYGLTYFIWEERFCKFVFHFDTRQIDVYYDIDPIVDQEPVVVVPFVDITAEDIGKICFGTNSGATKGLLYDDIFVLDAADNPVDTADYIISNAVYFQADNQVTARADVEKGSDPNGGIFAAAYDTAGKLSGVSDFAAVNGNTPFEQSFFVSGEVAVVKIFVWNNKLLLNPLGGMVEAELILSSP